LHAANLRKLESLSCAAVGFGAYRVGGGANEPQHAAALHAAIRGGVNLIDTSSHYRDPAGGAGSVHGASERLVGRVVQELLAAGEASRDELIVCTKLGHVDHQEGSEPPQGSVPIAGKEGNTGEAFHCIEPAFVEAEVRSSRERLGTAPDFVYLHNPEYFLSEQMRRRVPIGDAWGEM
jgi:aryl-alcohol dehydrogenase-like predicted oxidoreductase